MYCGSDSREMAQVFVMFLWLSMANAETHTSIVGYQPLWKYDDESKWPGHRCQSGGRRQSPIDIRTESVIQDYHRLFIKNGPLVFRGYGGVLVTGVNNGHTIQFTTEGEEMIHPSLSGGPLSYIYRLEQMHFHWESEHAINGAKFPMEIHFVHVRADLSVYEALSRRDGLAIVAVFCNVQSVLDDSPEEVAELMSYIPQLMKPGDRISGAVLDMTKLLSPNRTYYYTYSGSLTSPKCNEAVTWIIFPTPIRISDPQYQLFSHLSNGRPNCRRLQELNQHEVFTPPRPRNKIHVPEFVVFFEEVIRVIKIFFRNMTNMAAAIRGRR